ncbi:MAG: T9SS type A sorting domain-containing protein [Bacteroidales bacterium]|nr:T9SS type A sorting domain-containing protein [Bacteroidales bacterium]
MKKYLLSALFSVALLLPWVSQAQCDKLSDYVTPAVATEAFSSIRTTGSSWTTNDLVAGLFKFTMPFDMFFGSQTIHAGDTVYVSKNGYLSFGAQQATFPAPMSIAPMAYLDGNGYDAAQMAIYYKYDATTEEVIVEWHNATVDTLEFNFQVKLQKTDNIVKFCFGDITAATARYNFVQGIEVSAEELMGCTDSIAWPGYTRNDNVIETRTLTSYNTLPTNMCYTFSLRYRRPCVAPATEICATTAKANWSRVSPDSTVIYYQVFYSDDTTVVNELADSLSRHVAVSFYPTLLASFSSVMSDSNSATLSTLAAATTYYYTVYTTDGAGNGYLSDIVSFTTNLDTMARDTVHACMQYRMPFAVVMSDGSVDTNVVLTATDTTTFWTVRIGGMDSILNRAIFVEEPNYITTQAIQCDTFWWNIWYNDTLTPATVTTTAVDPTADTCLIYTATVDQAFIVPDSTLMLGCDLRMLNLVINYKAFDTVTAVACETYKWFIGGDSIDMYTNPLANGDSNIFVSNINHGTTTEGCDSVYALNLRLYGLGASTDSVKACDEFTWIDDSTYLASTTTPTFTVTGTNGCEHTVTLNLTLNNSSKAYIAPVTACDQYIWKVALKGKTTLNVVVDTFYTSDTVSYTYTDNNGCDSIIMLPLTINYKNFATLDTTVCNSFKWVGVDGRVYTKDTVIGYDLNKKYNVGTKKNVDGCDSICGLNLHVKYSTKDTVWDTACSNYEWHIVGTLHDTNTIDTTFTYTRGNNVTDVAQARNFTIDNAAGCDSIMTLKLWLKSAKTGSDTDTVIASCSSEYVYNGQRYAAPTVTNLTAGTANTYVINAFAGTAVNGCDSTSKVILYVGNPLYQAVNATACGEYTWTAGDGKTYAQLDENAPANAIYRNMTDGDYVYANTIPTYTFAGRNNNVDSATKKFVPDTVVSLHLNFQTAIYTYDAVSHLMTRDTLFLGPSYWVMSDYMSAETDTTFEESVFFGSTPLYCDSIVRYTIDLVYNFTKVPQVICMSASGYPLSWTAGDTTLTYMVPANANTTRDTNYIADIQIRNSGDDANEWGYILDITQLKNTYSTQYVTACGTYTWAENDSVYTYDPAATYPKNPADFVTLVGDNNCDSIVVLALTLNPLNEYTVQKCVNRYIWNLNGVKDTIDADFSNSNVFTTTVNRIDTLNGDCLSHDRLVLTLVKPDTVVERICAGPYTWDRTGATYTTSRVVTKAYNRSAICDSAVVLDLRIADGRPTYGRIDLNECEEYTWIIDVPNDYTMTTSTPYTFGTFDHDTTVGYMFANPRTGCDSILTLNLHVNAGSQGVDSVIACDAYTWVDGLYYTESTSTPRFRYANANNEGCDSIVTLVLTINYSQTQTINDTICAGNNYTANNFSILASDLPSQGTYRDNRVIAGGATNGCDIVTILNLRVNPVTTSLENVKACQNYTWNGITYTTDGTYTVHGQNVYGCDSTATLVLAIGQPSSSSQEFEACEQITYQGVTYTNTTILVNNTINEYGCENRDTIRLIVNQPSHSEQWVTEYGSFYWFNGTTYTTSGTYSATLPGADIHGCDSIITLYLTIVNGIEEAGDADILSLYPNPTYGKVTISAENVLRVEVLDIVGRRVATYENTNVLDLTNLAEGAYTLRITLPDGIAVRKVVKK